MRTRLNDNLFQNPKPLIGKENSHEQEQDAICRQEREERRVLHAVCRHRERDAALLPNVRGTGFSNPQTGKNLKSKIPPLFLRGGYGIIFGVPSGWVCVCENARRPRRNDIVRGTDAERLATSCEPTSLPPCGRSRM